MSNDNKLKPCPFCGGEAEITGRGNGLVACKDRTCPAFNIDATDEEWSRRASSWVSVEQGLPQERVVVLVIDSMFAKIDEYDNRKGYGNMRNPGVRFGYVTSSGFRVEGVNGDSYITHWMPLPGLPDVPDDEL